MGFPVTDPVSRRSWRPGAVRGGEPGQRGGVSGENEKLGGATTWRRSQVGWGFEVLGALPSGERLVSRICKRGGKVNLKESTHTLSFLHGTPHGLSRTTGLVHSWNVRNRTHGADEVSMWGMW